MRDSKLVDSGWHRCDSCGVVWAGRDLRDIQDLSQRIDAGGVVPSGECPDPECGALCYPSSAKKGQGFCPIHGEYPMTDEDGECPLCI